MSVLARFILVLSLSLAALPLLPVVRSQQPAQQPTQLPIQQGSQEQDAQKKEADDTISVETSLVVLNVTVTDGLDKFAAGLKRGDFKIYEDRVPQKIQVFSFDEMPFASAILLDASASMERKMTMARAACASFVDGIREGDVFAIYRFSGTKVKLLQDFTEVRDVPDALWDSRADSTTPLYDAVVMASDALAKREERRRAIILVSDGGDSTSRASFDEAIRRASAANVAVYAVDLSDAGVYKTGAKDLGAEALKNMADKTGGRLFKAPGGAALRDAFTSTVEELRHQYTLGYESTNDKQDGKWRKVEVQLNKPALSARTRQGYYAAKRKGS